MCFGGSGTPPSSYKLKIWEQPGITSCQMKTQTSPLPRSLFVPQQRRISLPFSMVFHMVLGGCGVGDTGWESRFHRLNHCPVCGPERWVYIGRRGRAREEDRLQPSPRMGPLTPYCVGSLQEGGLAVFQEMPSRLGRQTPEVFLSSQGL